MLLHLQVLRQLSLGLGERFEVVHLPRVVIGQVSRLLHPALHGLVQNARECLLAGCGCGCCRRGRLGLDHELAAWTLTDQRHPRCSTRMIPAFLQLLSCRVAQRPLPIQQGFVIGMQFRRGFLGFRVQVGIHGGRCQRDAQISLAVQFPSVHDFDRIHRTIPAGLCKLPVQPMPHEARTNRRTRRSIAEPEVDVKTLGSLREDFLERGRVIGGRSRRW
mmetsp:Transcript_19592/g.55305  ORF Transcript_19592/g.55305 Transcript_19592/m.55305 type:complete len:218 (-) Transcript_19592:287-940(-)